MNSRVVSEGEGSSVRALNQLLLPTDDDLVGWGRGFGVLLLLPLGGFEGAGGLVLEMGGKSSTCGGEATEETGADRDSYLLSTLGERMKAQGLSISFNSMGMGVFTSQIWYPKTGDSFAYWQHF